MDSFLALSHPNLGSAAQGLPCIDSFLSTKPTDFGICIELIVAVLYSITAWPKERVKIKEQKCRELGTFALFLSILSFEI